MAERSLGKQLVLPLVLVCLLSLAGGFFFIAKRPAPAPTEPIIKEVPRALLLPDTK